MRRNRPVRQVVVDVAAFRLLGEGLAHGANISWENPGLWPRFLAKMIASEAIGLVLGRDQLPSVDRCAKF
jgi:hypothetical protein